MFGSTASSLPDSENHGGAWRSISEHADPIPSPRARTGVFGPAELISTVGQSSKYAKSSSSETVAKLVAESDMAYGMISWPPCRIAPQEYTTLGT